MDTHFDFNRRYLKRNTTWTFFYYSDISAGTKPIFIHFSKKKQKEKENLVDPNLFFNLSFPALATTQAGGTQAHHYSHATTFQELDCQKLWH